MSRQVTRLLPLSFFPPQRTWLNVISCSQTVPSRSPKAWVNTGSAPCELNGLWNRLHLPFLFSYSYSLHLYGKKLTSKYELAPFFLKKTVATAEWSSTTVLPSVLWWTREQERASESLCCTPTFGKTTAFGKINARVEVSSLCASSSAEGRHRRTRVSLRRPMGPSRGCTSYCRFNFFSLILLLICQRKLQNCCSSLKNV